MKQNYFFRNYGFLNLTIVLVIFTCLGLVGINDLNAQCTADAGTLTANITPVQLAGGSVIISATENATPTVPGDYEIGYVLTSGPTLIIQDASLTPSFEITTAGDYTIHAMVAEINDPLDPNFLDLSGVIPGTTTGADILNLITTSGVCASLDVTGAPIVVESCTAAAGTLAADVTPVQLAGGSVTISATEDTAPTVPTNYEVAYVLTSGPTLIIEQTGGSPSFDVTSAGDYTIHTLVAELSDSTDPNYLDLSVVVPGTTTG
ncbi:hypothetical protein, partial [uncultured Algibacter sp.]|uniref:hypothetical protein n=1 Tax=uncultured Algibacter sp. TaxID=298659 RepID=UPI00260F2BF5